MKEFFEPPTIDLNLLRHFTEEAKKRGEQRAADRAEVCQALRVSAEEIQRHEDEIAANRVIVQIPERAEFEAMRGGHHASIMSFKAKNVGYIYYDPGWLTGPAKLVYEYCEKASLQPTLEYWEYWPDRDGPTKSGFHMVIHW